MKKILVCRIGAFGDICMTLPVVHALSEQFEVHWLIRQSHAAILKSFPAVKCHLVLFSSQQKHLVSELTAAKYDALLDFSNWAIVGRLAGQLKNIPIRAIAYDSNRKLLLQRIKYGLPFFRPFNRVVHIDGAVHRVYKWQRLIDVTLEHKLSICWPLKPVKSLGQPIRIFVHPHASKPKKLWPLANFARALTGFAEKQAIQVFINEGNSLERKTAETLEAGLKGEGIDTSIVSFDASFVGLRKALEQVDFALGLDSGPLHFASLMGVPSLVIYGPYSPVEIAPLWRTVAVTPPRGSVDIRDITPLMVLDGIGRLSSFIYDRLDIGVRL